MPFQLKGQAEMRARLMGFAAKFPEVIKAAMYQEAEIEMTESKQRVPFQYGVLKASGHVQLPIQEGRNIIVMMAYGGAASEYAVPVHENLDAYHPHGQAKYLESVLNESRPYMLGRIARRLKIDKVAI